MNWSMERSAASAILTLHESLSRQVLVTSIPFHLRPEAIEQLWKATGASLQNNGSRQWVAVEGRPAVSNERDVDTGALSIVARRLASWITSDGPVSDVGRRRRLPLGARAILEQNGINPDKALWFAILHHVLRLRRDKTSIMIETRGECANVEYRISPRTIWRNGIVSVRRTILPETILVSLPGQTVSRVVDAPIIHGALIRQALRSDPRERVLRLVTEDAGRWEAD